VSDEPSTDSTRDPGSRRIFGLDREQLLIAVIASLVGALVGAAVLAIVTYGPRVHPSIGIKNDLLDPVSIMIDGESRGDLRGQSSKSFTLRSAVADVSWTVVRASVGGRPLGDEMSGASSGVEDGESIEVTRTVGTTYYFTPVITNETDRTCDVEINGDGNGAGRLGVSQSPQTTLRFGYFRLTSSSSVGLVCDGVPLWFGIRGTQGNPLSASSDDRSGEASYTFDRVFATPSPTSAIPSPTSSATPSAGSTPPACPVAQQVNWENHEPNFDPSIQVRIGPCQTVMFSSQTLDVPGGSKCDEGTNTVCVLVARADLVPRSVTANGLMTSWYGLTSASISQAIQDKREDSIKGWFSPSNCMTGHGCNKAIVFVLNADGTVARQEFTGP
jgi:hypothetical protein